jgi:hypothetical protein
MSANLESYQIGPELESARSAQNPRELGRTYFSALKDAGFEIPDEYGLEEFLNYDTGLAVAQPRNVDDNFERPTVDPRLTFRLQDHESTPNSSSVEQYPAPEDIPEHLVAGDLRIPVEEPIPSDVASGKTKAAEILSDQDPYFQAGERSVDLRFAVTDANPPGTIPTSMQNLREVAEALSYIQDQRVPPQMALAAFDDRIQANRAPDVVQPFQFESADEYPEVEAEDYSNFFQEREPFSGSFESLSEGEPEETGIPEPSYGFEDEDEETLLEQKL